MPQTMTGGQVTPQQQNLIARQAVIRQGVDMWLPIFQRRYSALNNQGPGLIENVPLRNVGLVKRLLIELGGTVTAGATDLNLSFNGIANFLSNVTFTDLSNQSRINTTGWHLFAVSTAKRRRAFGYNTNHALLPPVAALNEINPAQSPAGYGGVHGVLIAADPIPAGASATINMFWEVPFSYTDHDLRGAIYANVTNATMNLQFTVNPQMFGTIGNINEQLGIYNSTDGSGTLTSFTIKVYQNFLDQLPIAQQGGPVLPLLDLSTAYLLNNTNVSGLVQTQDNPIPFANFRDFMSFIVIYNDVGINRLGTGPGGGRAAAYLNTIKLQSANYTNILNLDSATTWLLSRLIIADDFPYRMWYLDFRHKPISTIQYGNMEVILNPDIVTSAQSSFIVGFESLALINMITQAGSLYGS